MLVNMIQCKEQFRSVEFDSRLWESLLSFQMEKQLTSVYEFHHHVQFFRCLERIEQVDKERMFDILHHRTFRLDMLNLIALCQLGLVQNLHGKDFARILLPHLQHLVIPRVKKDKKNEKRKYRKKRK